MKNQRLNYGLLLALLLVGFVSLLHAQSTGYRWSGSSLILAGNGAVCFEPTYNAGPDTCVQRSGAGHLSFLNGSLAPSPDISGTATLSAGTKVVTFTTAFTVAPLCLATWNGSGAFTTGASLKCVTTTTTATFTSSTGTDTAVINYEIVPNPN